MVETGTIMSSTHENPVKGGERLRLEFLTVKGAREIHLGNLFGPNDDPNQRCAVAFTVTPEGQTARAALIEADEKKYQRNKEYREEIESRVSALFGLEIERL